MDVSIICVRVWKKLGIYSLTQIFFFVVSNAFALLLLSACAQVEFLLRLWNNK